MVDNLFSPEDCRQPTTNDSTASFSVAWLALTEMPRQSKRSKGASKEPITKPAAKKAKSQRKNEYRPDDDDEVIEEAKDRKTRCWGTKSLIALDYHDTFWGRPCYDPTELYGSLCLQVR